MLIILATSVLNHPVGYFGFVSRVSVSDVVVFLDVFFERWVVFALFYVVPIYRFKEGVRLHLLQSQTLGRVFLEQANEEIPQLLG